MKYFKRANIYKANNVTFNPETMVADSYDWWHFVERIKGKVVFNNYNYSPTTNRHQSKVRSLLRELNINIDVEVSTRRGLQASYGVQSSQDLCLDAIREAVMSEDLERAHKIAAVFKFKLTQDRIQFYFDQKEEQLCSEYLERAYQYSEKKRKKEEELSRFLENVDIIKITKDGKSLIVSKFDGDIVFHISGNITKHVRREADICSPNAVADICMNRLNFQLTSEEVVKISNFC